MSAWEEPRLTEQEMEELVLAVIRRKIFLSGDIRPHELHLAEVIFMPLGFMGQQERKKLVAHPPMLFYAWYRDAIGSRGINGYPMFSRVCMLYQQDTAILMKRVEAIEASMKTVAGGG